MNNGVMTTQDLAQIKKLGEEYANNRANTLWAILAFVGVGVFLILLLVTFVWWNFGIVHATWAIGVVLLILGGVGGAAMVSAWNDRVQARALDMMKTKMYTETPMWNVDPQEMRRQNAVTMGTRERHLITQQAPPQTGFIFDDDDVEIIEVKQ